LTDSLDTRWLDAAASLAMPSLGSTGQTPAVGAILLDPDTQQVLGRAATPEHGLAQAVPLALADADGLTAGATLYVTLEPAAHYTNLAPVTGDIIDAGIARVVVGALDPDRQRAGEGLRELAEAGIEIAYVEHEPSRLLNEGYATRLTKGRPFVTMKMTLSPDGMVGYNAPGQPQLLGVEALRFVERERAAADAVLSGAARASIEDNDLCVHLDGLEARGALRVVLAGAQDLDMDLELFAAVSGVPIMVVTTEDRPLSLRAGIEVLAVDGQRDHPDLRKVLAVLADRGINRVFVEAGARLAETFIAGELVDRIHVIEIAAEIGRSGVPAALLGSFEDRIAAARFSEVDRRTLGEDKVRVLEREPEKLQAFPAR
jgi:diaminohydroxyphosphoribosylaminopyrimidine deaminase/5-amino-6-(5-phosphoribosylamino)uracil reductase